MHKFSCSQYNRKPANELDLIYVMVLKRFTHIYIYAWYVFRYANFSRAYRQVACNL